MPRPKRSVQSSLSAAEESQVRSDFLLDKAAAVFAEVGYAKTTIDEVARRAKASKRSFYLRFPRKDDLFLAVLKRQISLVSARSFPLLDTEKPVRIVLESFAHVLIGIVLSSQHVELLRIIAAEAKRFPDIAEEYYAFGPIHSTQQLAAYIAEQGKRGKLLVHDPLVAAEQFFELTTGALVRRALLGQVVVPGDEENRRRIQEGINVFLIAYERQQAVF